MLERLREERTLYDALMARALRLASTTFADLDVGPTIFVQGTSLLLDDVGGDDPEATLADAASAAADDRGEDAAGAAARRVHERRRADDRHRLGAPAPDLQPFSLVVSTYSDGRATGAVGVIGPTRMRYSRAINAVDRLSQTIGRMVASKS